MVQPESRVPFQQPNLQVEKPEEFEQLRSALARIFAAGSVIRFLKLLQRKGVPIRDFDRIMNERLFEAVDTTLAKSGRTAKQWYESITVSDQAQTREFYFTTLEEVALPLREKFSKLYRYY
jgi:transposase-like protein